MDSPFLIALFLLLTAFAADLASGGEDVPLIGAVVVLSLVIFAIFRLIAIFRKKRDSK